MTTLVVILVLQWVLLIAMAVVLLAVVRQVGVLHQRVAPAGALTISHAIKAGEAAPELRLRTLDGDDAVIGGAGHSRGTLLMFVAPDCPVCAALIPAVKAIGKQESAWLRVIFASDGETLQHARFRRDKGLTDFPYVVSMQLGLTYQVGKLPYAVLLDEQGILIAQGLVNSREHLESLFEAKRLRVASLQQYLQREGRSLDGEAVKPVTG
ncbi:methylamine dehydrogenase accessory protein MauD [Steroidobacter sp.]|uniref:methylamine dehydrogenase accessory protein MauD n=1 Tax=Steroidobacter sp. TaxID=1978227 RepID=UPI001A3DD5FD|nr:methylamine dehydrogenase accessory protein MauD [Steroidobacter sp.]MBL8265113.1 methylamine dehydrogenase accessory protein MauD [Steroidobacter sp.]